MPDPRRHAAALVAVLLLTFPASALAVEPTLLAQIDEVAQTEQTEQPPLSEDPPSQLGEGGDGEEQAQGEEEPTTAGEPDPLPETGIEAGLVALLGLGLIASGSGLRLRLGRDGL